MAEGKYVDRQMQVVSLTDQVVSLDDERQQLLQAVEDLTKTQIRMQDELSKLRKKR